MNILSLSSIGRIEEFLNHEHELCVNDLIFLFKHVMNELKNSLD